MHIDFEISRALLRGESLEFQEGEAGVGPIVVFP